ncbi:hypothetical protein Tco_0201380 [Tanacetum coccineum]
MSGSQDEIPPPPPSSSSQTPTQQTPHTVSTIKLPILKKGEYDIWAMKMEHYLAYTDYLIWEVIQNGNGPISITTDTQGQIKVLPPRTIEEILARERERKARTTLLMALPKDHLAKFHKMTDAKEMWDAIKSRFGGNDESKKMQKYILKQQFKGFSRMGTPTQVCVCSYPNFSSPASRPFRCVKTKVYEWYWKIKDVTQGNWVEMGFDDLILSKYGKIWYDDDIHDLISVETKFPAIAFNDGVSSEKTLSCEPTVSSLNDEIDFRVSFDDSGDEDYTIFFDKNSFFYKKISTNDLKTDSGNDNKKVNLLGLPSHEPTVSCLMI